MKPQIGWIGLLTSFWVIVVLAPELFGWQALSGFPSVVMRFFLGYCAIILVAQVFSALGALRNLAKEAAAGRKAIPQQVLFKTGQPNIAPEE